MKKFLLVFLLAVVLIVGSAFARVETEDIPCEGRCATCISRMVDFWDDNNPGATTPYYYYYILCDGTVVEKWLGDVHPIGALPVWAFPWYGVGSVNSSGVWIDQVFVGSYLAATITYDQIDGHSATVTTYPNPFE